MALAVALLAIVATVPWRTRALKSDANLEHVGINLSSPVFKTSPDGIKYRDATGWATLFVPAGAFKVSINVQSDRPVRLEARLEGRKLEVHPSILVTRSRNFSMARLHHGRPLASPWKPTWPPVSGITGSSHGLSDHLSSR